mmetsp:Transcript_110403/g.308579  ORF Transcript_110403/g.308579 Transcript_110403/m.308579 type:complete len:350 (+) Transcript_110403:1951-3000(+)
MPVPRDGALVPHRGGFQRGRPDVVEREHCDQHLVRTGALRCLLLNHDPRLVVRRRHRRQDDGMASAGDPELCAHKGSLHDSVLAGLPPAVAYGRYPVESQDRPVALRAAGGAHFRASRGRAGLGVQRLHREPLHLLRGALRHVAALVEGLRNVGILGHLHDLVAPVWGADDFQKEHHGVLRGHFGGQALGRRARDGPRRLRVLGRALQHVRGQRRHVLVLDYGVPVLARAVLAPIGDRGLRGEGEGGHGSARRLLPGDAAQAALLLVQYQPRARAEELLLSRGPRQGGGGDHRGGALRIREGVPSVARGLALPRRNWPGEGEGSVEHGVLWVHSLSPPHTARAAARFFP